MSASKGRVSQYEVMFLISQSAATDLKAVLEHIRLLVSRAGGTILAMRKWDERRLAFEIDKQKRGTYILMYFSTDPVKMPGFERDCNLSENIMRTLVLKADFLTLEEMQASDGQRELELEAQMKGAPGSGAGAGAGPIGGPTGGSMSASKAAGEPEPAGV